MQWGFFSFSLFSVFNQSPSLKKCYAVTNAGVILQRHFPERMEYQRWWNANRKQTNKNITNKITSENSEATM